MNHDINSIIDELAEIDSASAKIMQKTQQEKKQYSDYITEQKQLYDNDLEQEIDKTIKSYKQSEDIKNKELIEKYKEDCKKNISKLNQLFEDNSEKWADEIFNNVIKE